MAKTDIHLKPFDEGTITKLEIFKQYLEEWLPVFLSNEKPFWGKIFIYDFFAGEGKDSSGNYGSPLIILEVLKKYSHFILEEKVEVKLVFNEKDQKKFKQLNKNIDAFDLDLPVQIITRNNSFQDFFEEIYPIMQKNPHAPRLVFLDQYGIKEITSQVFKKLISFKRTDFIFFVSSSFVRRFNEQEEFKNYLTISKEEFDESKPFHSHRVVFNYYKNLLDPNSSYVLSPFSIKKGKNIYGLIFGSNHIYGIEKFLKVCWKLNPFTGDANYNIDEESIVHGQLSMFGENKPRKLVVYKELVVSKIESGELKSLLEVYSFTLEYGCLPKHANEILIELIKKEKIKPLKTKSEKVHTCGKQMIILKKDEKDQN